MFFNHDWSFTPSTRLNHGFGVLLDAGNKVVERGAPVVRYKPGFTEQWSKMGSRQCLANTKSFRDVLTEIFWVRQWVSKLYRFILYISEWDEQGKASTDGWTERKKERKKERNNEPNSYGEFTSMHNRTGSATLKPRTLELRSLGLRANSRFVVQHTLHRTGDELWSSIQGYVNTSIQTGYEQVSNEHLPIRSLCCSSLRSSHRFDNVGGYLCPLVAIKL